MKKLHKNDKNDIAVFTDENKPNVLNVALSPVSTSYFPKTPNAYGLGKSPDEKLQARGLPFTGDLTKASNVDVSPLRSAAVLFNTPSLESVNTLVNRPIMLNQKVQNLSRQIITLLSNNFKYQRRSPEKSIDSTSIDTFFSEMLNGATKVSLNGEQASFWHLQCVFIDTLVPLYRLRKQFDDRTCVIKDTDLDVEDKRALSFCENVLSLSSEFMKQIWGMLNNDQRNVVLSRVDEKVKQDLMYLSPLRKTHQERSESREVLRDILYDNNTPLRPSRVCAQSLDNALINAPKRGFDNFRYISSVDIVKPRLASKVRWHRVSAFPDIFPAPHAVSEAKQVSDSFAIA